MLGPFDPVTMFIDPSEHKLFQDFIKGLRPKGEVRPAAGVSSLSYTVIDGSQQQTSISDTNMTNDSSSASSSNTSTQESERNYPILSTPAEEEEIENHLELVRGISNPSRTVDLAKIHEVSTSPLFSSQVQAQLRKRKGKKIVDYKAFSQYGLLGLRIATNGVEHDSDQAWEKGINTLPRDNLIYNNVDAPSSTFICGSQGSGKSHTLSCMLENSLLSDSAAGMLPNPLAGIVFHYDNFTGHSSTQLCEAAYLCSRGIPVRVLVSPSNIYAMKRLYSKLPGLPADVPKPQILPLHFQERQLNIAMIKTLMAVNSSETKALYLGIVDKILRDLAFERHDKPGLDYKEFRRRLAQVPFSQAQVDFLEMRLQMLESFLAFNDANDTTTEKTSLREVWSASAGTLTIVDLSCPFVDEGDACALFSICLDRFMENRGECGRVVALDEAHKFLNTSGQAESFTKQLTSIICQQRHLATRIMIATQEPTLSPRLLDLCNLTIVHRFSSPDWFSILRKHIAAAHHQSSGRNEGDGSLLQEIVGLETGTALVFAPTAVLDVTDGQIQTLKDGHFKIKVRARITADGGKSIMASAGAEIGPERPVSPPLLVKTYDRVPRKDDEVLGGVKKGKPASTSAANAGTSTSTTNSKPAPTSSTVAAPQISNPRTAPASILITGPGTTVRHMAPRVPIQAPPPVVSDSSDSASESSGEPDPTDPPDNLCARMYEALRCYVWECLDQNLDFNNFAAIREAARIRASQPRDMFDDDIRRRWANAVIRETVQLWREQTGGIGPTHIHWP